jgi:thiol-disulfide isomerase/thioredoxin
MAARGAIITAALLLSAGSYDRALAQTDTPPKPGAFSSLNALNEHYQRQLAELDRRRIADLDALASKLAGHDSDSAYRELFDLAIAHEFFSEAEPAANRYRAMPSGARDIQGLATFIVLVANGKRGDHQRSMDELKSFVKLHTRPGVAPPPADSDPILTVGEAYLQRLIRAAQYDTARQVCDLILAGDATPATKEHFKARMARIDLLGKPALRIFGMSVDGFPIRLANYTNQVVLVEFWATWCPPCVAAMPTLNALEAKYKSQGFEILGINVDTEHENVKDAKTALPVVRRFLVQNHVRWTNLLNGDGDSDFAKAYGVEHIPANFLIGRDGKIIAFELSGESLEKAIVRALGAP